MSKLKIISSDINELDESIQIARYYSYEKFKDVLNGAIWFSHIKKFEDNHEREPERIRCKNQKGKEIAIKISNSLNKKCEAYVSCWTEFKNENEALWKLYDRYSTGVCLVTTVKRFKQQLPPDILIDRVNYADKEGAIVPQIHIDEIASNYLATEFIKISPYKYEEEVRAVFYCKEIVDDYKISIDIADMVTKIIISPLHQKSKVKY